MKNKRQDEILKLLHVEQHLKTEQLMQTFGVSIETIRRDINALEQKGLVKKVYGGISIASEPLRIDTLENWHTRTDHCHAEKVKIARRALELIPDNSVIALDIGTTTYELARLLGAKKNLSIVTSSLLIASELAQNTLHHVYAIGGLVSPNEIVTSGSFARNFLKNFASIDYFLMGADGISLKHGITDFGEAVADVKQQIHALSNQCIALIDHSKFGREALFKTCELKDIDILVTDQQSPKKDLETMQKLGVNITIADAE